MNKYVVAELHNNKMLGASVWEDRESAVSMFCTLVEEYGVVAYEEMINSGLFESDDGYTVQMIETK